MMPRRDVVPPAPRRPHDGVVVHGAADRPRRPTPTVSAPAEERPHDGRVAPVPRRRPGSAAPVPVVRTDQPVPLHPESGGTPRDGPTRGHAVGHEVRVPRAPSPGLGCRLFGADFAVFAGCVGAKVVGVGLGPGDVGGANLRLDLGEELRGLDGVLLARLRVCVVLLPREQVREVLRLEEPPLLRVLQDLRREKLLVDLPVVDFFLDCPRGDESVHGDLFRLPDSPRALASLGVRARIPVRIVEEHPVRARQVDPETPNLRGEEKHEDVVVAVELVDESHAVTHRGRPVHSPVRVPGPRDRRLEDVQHLLRLAEQQAPVPLLAPQPQDLLRDEELPASLSLPVLLRVSLGGALEKVGVIDNLPQDVDPPQRLPSSLQYLLDVPGVYV